ncbi:hypothetical protein BDV19DRAFT_370593 [Aspergillus venezuelensis]
MLEIHVVKKPLVKGGTRYDGYIPDTTIVSARDENEMRVLEVVREYTGIPEPKLVYRGEGQVYSIGKDSR